MLLALVPVAAWATVRLTDDPAPTAALPASTTEAIPPTSTIVAFEAPTGERSTAARCWMVVIDESASMATADSTGTRADAVRATNEFLAVYGLDDDRIAVTWFADRADAGTPRPASASAAAPIPPIDLGGGTDIATALHAALDTVTRGCGTAEPVLILVSDGQANSQADFDATKALLADAAPEVAVHLIAMNGGGAFEPVRSYWEDPALGLASIETIASFGSADVAGAVARILSLETGQQITPR
jgi:Mg-chelatase subunit ChlD